MTHLMTRIQQHILITLQWPVPATTDCEKSQSWRTEEKYTVIGEPVDVNAFKGVAKRQLSVWTD